MINVEISMTMAAVGVGLLLFQGITSLIKTNAMIDYISLYCSWSDDFRGGTGVNFSHDKPSDKTSCMKLN